MTKQVYPNSEIPHIWANQTQDSARNSGHTLYFEGKTIYSYRDSAPIGTLFGENEVFLANRTFSPTTSKHQSRVRMAVTHKKAVYVYHVPTQDQLKFAPNFNNWLQKELASKIAELKALKEKYPRQRTQKLITMELFVTTSADYKPLIALLKSFDLEFNEASLKIIKEYKKECTLPKDWEEQKNAAIEEGALRIARYDGKLQKERIVRRDSILEDLKIMGCTLPSDLDIEDFHAVNYFYNEMRSLERSRTLKLTITEKLGVPEAELSDKTEEELQIILAIGVWKLNDSLYPEHVQTVHNPFTYLKLSDKGEIMTSKGIKLSIFESSRAIAAVRRGRLLGQEFQGYKITKVDYDTQTVVAGCHTIPFSEIEGIQKAMSAAQLKKCGY